MGSTAGGFDRVEALAVVDLAVRAAAAYDRPDLVADLDAARLRLAAPGARVLVLGDDKQGKSTLVNALAGAPVCPTDDDAPTTLATVVHHAPGRPAAAGAAAVLVAAGHRRPVDKADLAAAVTGRGGPAVPTPVAEDAGDGRAGWLHAEIGLPDDTPGGLLADGLVLVDTPGTGGLSAPHRAAALADAPGAHAVVLVSDASRELTAPELALLADAARCCPVVVLALTRTDLAPRWREVRDLDRAHLAAAGLDVEVIGVSAPLAAHDRRLARARGETGASPWSEESGLGALAELLVRRVADPVATRGAREALGEVVAVVGEMSAALDAERAVLTDPDHAADLAADLADARERATRLRERTARWQQTLSDGVTDLVSDIEWDLRDRVRHVVRAAEEALEASDPATSWAAFSPWFAEQISEAVSTTFGWAGERTWRLAERVGTHFAADDEDVRAHLPGGAAGAADAGAAGAGTTGAGTTGTPVLVSGTVPGGHRIAGQLPAVPDVEDPDLERVGLAHGLVVGMRGSYGGVLMVGMITTLSGLALVNPFSIGAGVVLGTKTVRDERRRALARRRSDAKTAVRKHADEVLHLGGKRARDMLREVQRTLRDHFTARAESLTRTVADAVTAATAAREVAVSARDRRLRDVRAELTRVEALAARAAAARDAVPAVVGVGSGGARGRRPGAAA